MIRSFTLKSGAFLLLLYLVLGQQAYAQVEIDQFLAAGTEDASRLTEAYMAPAARGLGYGLNNGWYNTGDTHKTLGFDLSITVTAAFIPDTDKTFLFRNSDYQNLRLRNGSEATTSTIAGENADGPEVVVLEPNTGLEVDDFNLPPGIGLDDEIGFTAVPVPMIQGGIGLPKGTDLMVRFVPDINIDEVTLSLWGVGLKHDIKQWIPGIKLLPFSLSVFGGYTRMSSDLELEGTFDGEGQNATMDISAFTAQVLISKKLSVITFYGGLGFNTSNADVKMNGTYNVTYDGAPTVTLVDPVDITLDNSSFRGTLGFRLKFGVFFLNADYTLAEYNMATMGLGISFR